MGRFFNDEQILGWQENQHKVWIQPWGKDGIRVRANLAGKPLELPQALLETAAVHPSGVTIEIGAEQAVLRSGLMQATIERDGRICFTNSQTGNVLLEERSRFYFMPPNRHFKYTGNGLHQIENWFEAKDGERLYGLGQHQHGRLDQKGCVIDLQQRNTEVTIPFMVSNRKYGFLWNNPGVGRVELGQNATRWVADGSKQLDYYVTCGGTMSDIMQRYAEVTGFTPPMPDWATGFWQCKLRYKTQEELLTVAREYKKRGLPLSVIVTDFFHWAQMGDWRFDPDCWPDPEAMIRELDEMGVKLMVSIWPTVVPISENYDTMKERGLLVNNEFGVDAQHVFVDHNINGPAYFAYCDSTNPEARHFMWDVVKKNYYDKGVKMFWLDNDEPDINPWDPQNLRFYLGNGTEVASIYPLLHQQAFYEGMRAEGETDIVTLSRSGWAGSQRFSSVIWSGDVPSTFEALQSQLRAGLNVAMSGIPWWTTDIGGFHGGNIETPYFRELIVRWFQYGLFCPIFRLHGHRQPEQGPLPDSGGDNEVWSFGDDAYELICNLLTLRERLRPYIKTQMQLASDTGLPPMRPLFVDFEDDAVCETVDDQFLFGPDILVAPILHEGARERKIYLPEGAEWTDAWKGTPYSGGQWLDVAAPLDTIPVFLKADSGLEPLFAKVR